MCGEDVEHAPLIIVRQMKIAIPRQDTLEAASK
jgi:hypothetical protein